MIRQPDEIELQGGVFPDKGQYIPLGRPAPLNKTIAALSGSDLCYAKDPDCGICAPHTCPFQTEIIGDHEFNCRCCKAFEHECYMDT